jgi:hypothetical protein
VLAAELSEPLAHRLAVAFQDKQIDFIRRSVEIQMRTSPPCRFGFSGRPTVVEWLKANTFAPTSLSRTTSQCAQSRHRHQTVDQLKIAASSPIVLFPKRGGVVGVGAGDHIAERDSFLIIGEHHDAGTTRVVAIHFGNVVINFGGFTIRALRGETSD